MTNPTVDISDVYLIGLQVGDTKYKVFSAKDTNGFVEKTELALYYHGITATFYFIRLLSQSEKVDITTTAEVYDYRIDVIEY